MNLAVQVGHVVRDFEVQQTANGLEYVRFTLAVASGYGDNKKTFFFDYSAWGKAAHALAQYAKQGTKLLVEAEPVQNRYTDKNGQKRSDIVFNIHQWEFAQKKGENADMTEIMKEAPEKPKRQSKKREDKQEPVPAPVEEEPWLEIPDGIDDTLPFA